MKLIVRTKEFIADKDFKEILPAELGSITFGLIAGILLTTITGKLELIPGLLILLPGFLEMHGNILGSLSARLGTKLHTKEIKPKFNYNKVLKDNVLASAFLMILVSIILGILAYLAIFFIFKVNSLNILFISLFASIISIILTIPLTIWMSFWFFKHNYDPDDIMGPYITSLGDIISVIAIAVATLLII